MPFAPTTPFVHLADWQSDKTACCGIPLSSLRPDEPITDRKEDCTCRPRLKDVVCPQCRKPFTLCWDEYPSEGKPQTLILRGCPSGGIYDVSISCPHCDYREEL